MAERAGVTPALGRVARNPRLAVAQGYVAAVRAGDIERDRKAEPGAAFVLVARVVERRPRASTMAPVSAIQRAIA